MFVEEGHNCTCDTDLIASDYPCRRDDNGQTNCGPFKPFTDKATILSYHEAPVEVFEDAAEMLVWGHKALDAALRGRNTKQFKPRKKPRHNLTSE